MGFYDRDYMRAPRRSSFGQNFGPQSITTWLIIINVAVFILDRLFARRMEDMQGAYFSYPIKNIGYFSVATAVQHFQVWRFITFQFLHANLDHLVFNMLSLFFFGPIVESYLGSRRFIPFYLLSGIGGALMYMLLLLLRFQIGDPYVPLVGASAGIFGILIAAALIAPNATVLFMMVFPMPLRTMAWLFIAYAVLQIVARGNNAGGEAAHLGGAALGYLLMQNPRILDFLNLPSRRRMRYKS
ncbi:MAG TPA: rhomboid family intramembrane serine protease [Tepidisphaeraceae bacterium]|jgi:membrane associated rhomboid family serine protease